MSDTKVIVWIIVGVAVLGGVGGIIAIKIANGTDPTSVPVVQVTASDQPPVAKARMVSPTSSKPPVASAPVNQPAVLPEQFRGFRGIPWGTNLATFPDMYLDPNQSSDVRVTMEDESEIRIKDLHTKDYDRFPDKRSFGPAAVGAITYRAFDGQFYEVIIHDANAFELSTAFSTVYGNAQDRKVGDTRMWTWNPAGAGEKLRIFMSYDYTNGFSIAVITYVPLEEKLKALQRAEAKVQLERAKKDF